VKSRPAFALVAAIVSLVLIAALVTGALFASNQETHATAAEIIDQKVSTYAERVAFTSAADWQCPECDEMAVGSVIIRNPASSPPLESTVFITRLDSALYLVTGEGRINEAGVVRARRRVSVAVKIARDSLGVPRSSRIDGESWAVAYQM
jgi:hypothetical protein